MDPAPSTAIGTRNSCRSTNTSRRSRSTRRPLRGGSEGEGMTLANIPVEPARGDTLRCKGWRQEGILRMLENTVANGEKPAELIIYGGSGRAARNWDSFHAIVAALKGLGDDETL